ncbi:MAG: DUF3048 domain-containing protein [Leptolinea sp.]
MSVLYRCLILIPILAGLIGWQSNAATSPTVKPTALQTTVEQIKTSEPTPTAAIITPIPLSTDTAVSAISASIEPAHYGPDRFPKGINPFTGLSVDDPAILDRRPVMVKVANFPPSGRPQFGLSFADLVFEHYIGEGMNRFSAIFYGQKPEKVGPVRSARLADVQLASMYQTIFAFASADPRVRNNLLAELDGLSIIVKESTCPALCDTGAHTVNSVFADISKLDTYAKVKGINNYRQIINGMVFNSIPPESALSQIKFIQIRYNDLNQSEWRYDLASNKYLRWTESDIPEIPVKLVPLEDQLTGKQLAFDNIILLYARYNEYNPTLHNIELWANQDGRRASFFRDGRMISGFWRSPATNLPLEFFDDSGRSIPLKPGSSWIIILGQESTIDQSQSGQWKVQFAIQ